MEQQLNGTTGNLPHSPIQYRNTKLFPVPFLRQHYIYDHLWQINRTVHKLWTRMAQKLSIKLPTKTRGIPLQTFSNESFSSKNPSTSTLKNSSIFQSCWIMGGNFHHVSQEPGEIPHARYFWWLFPARIATAPFASQRVILKVKMCSELKLHRNLNKPEKWFIHISCL